MKTNGYAAKQFLLSQTAVRLQVILFSLIAALKTLNRLNKEGEALALQDDLTTHPTLALMRRILADAQVSHICKFETSFNNVNLTNRTTFNLVRHNRKCGQMTRLIMLDL